MSRSRRVIGRAYALGRGRLGYLFGLAALIFVPLGMIDALDGLIADVDLDEVNDLEAAAVFGGAAVQVLSATLGTILYSGAVALIVLGGREGAEPTLRQLIVRTRWLPLIAIDVLFVLGLIGTLLLLVIPGAIFFARYVLSAVVAEIEDLGVRRSFRRSAELTAGARWLTFGLMFGVVTAGELATEGLVGLAGALGADGILVDWISSAGFAVLYNPLAGLLAVALALELGARAASRHAVSSTRAAS